MAVILSKANVTWVAPTDGTDGLPLSGGDVVTGYIVGARSTTASGSTAGTYPFTATVGNVLTVALATVLAANLKADNYAVAVQAQSADGPSAWSSEFDVTVTVAVPNPPISVSVA